MLVLALLVLAIGLVGLFTSLAAMQHETSRDPTVDQARVDSGLLLAAREQVIELAASSVQHDTLVGIEDQVIEALRGGDHGVDALALGMEAKLAGQDAGAGPSEDEEDLIDGASYRSGLWTVGGEECLGGLPADGMNDGLIFSPGGQLLAVYVHLELDVVVASLEEVMLVDVQWTSNAQACT